MLILFQPVTCIQLPNQLSFSPSLSSPVISHVPKFPLKLSGMYSFINNMSFSFPLLSLVLSLSRSSCNSLFFSFLLLSSFLSFLYLPLFLLSLPFFSFFSLIFLSLFLCLPPSKKRKNDMCAYVLARLALYRMSNILEIFLPSDGSICSR